MQRTYRSAAVLALFLAPLIIPRAGKRLHPPVCHHPVNPPLLSQPRHHLHAAAAHHHQAGARHEEPTLKLCQAVQEELDAVGRLRRAGG